MDLGNNRDVNKSKKHVALTIWTLITHSLIVFVGGHSVGNILLLEAAFIGNVVEINENFGFDANWQLLVVFTIIGQGLLTFSISKQKVMRTVKVIGIFTLIIGAAFLKLQAVASGYVAITLISALPFLACASLLTYKILRTV